MTPEYWSNVSEVKVIRTPNIPSTSDEGGTPHNFKVKAKQHSFISLMLHPSYVLKYYLQSDK